MPVDVGDLMVFNSRVLYTLPDGDPSLVMMEVEAWVTAGKGQWTSFQCLLLYLCPSRGYVMSQGPSFKY